MTRVKRPKRPTSAMSRQIGGRPAHVWYSKEPPRVAHEAFTYSGGVGMHLLVCDQCGLATRGRRYSTPMSILKGDFDRAHRAQARNGYVGRHRAPVPRPKVRVM